MKTEALWWLVSATTLAAWVLYWVRAMGGL
jgi:hypothetical protein